MSQKGLDMFAGIKICLMISTLAVSTIQCVEALGAEPENEAFNYDNYAEVLKSYVDDKGMVNYKQLKANRAKLDTFARELSMLDDQTRRFLSDQKKFKIDREDGKVSLSPIFKWFGSDFINKYGLEKTLPRLNKTETAVINYLSRIPEEGDRDYLVKGNFKINYLSYDWSLNEQ